MLISSGKRHPIWSSFQQNYRYIYIYMTYIYMGGCTYGCGCVYGGVQRDVVLYVVGVQRGVGVYMGVYRGMWVYIDRGL